MPATSLSEIKNYRGAVLRALTAMHTAVGGKPIVPRSPDENADDIYIVPFFNLGRASGHRYRRPDLSYDFDIFENCTYGFDLSIPRLPRTPTATLIGTYDVLEQEVLRIMLALDPARWSALNAALPWHHLTIPKPQGETYGLDEATMEDKATVTFVSEQFGILTGAWPTDPAAYTNLPT